MKYLLFVPMGVAMGLVFGVQLSFGAAQTVSSVAKVYIGKKLESKLDEPPIFEIKRTEVFNGKNEKLNISYYDREHREISIQMLEFENGVPTGYSFRFPESKVSGAVQVTPKELVFEITEEGKKKLKRISKPENFAIGPSVNHYIKSHFNELKEKKSLKVQLAVASMMDIFEIELELTNGDEENVKNGKWLKLKMNPTNIVYKTFAPGMTYYISSKTGTVTAFVGPVGPRKDDQGMKGLILYPEVRE